MLPSFTVSYSVSTESFFFVFVPGIDLMTSCLPIRCRATELYPRPKVQNSMVKLRLKSFIVFHRFKVNEPVNECAWHSESVRRQKHISYRVEMKPSLEGNTWGRGSLHRPGSTLPKSGMPRDEGSV